MLHKSKGFANMPNKICWLICVFQLFEHLLPKLAQIISILQ